MQYILFNFQYQNDPILEKDLKCIFLNHGNPYLKLGPFKLEPKLQNPEIAIIHDMIGPEEMKRVKNLAKGKMKSTPYTVGGSEQGFSKGRTSKVMYMNELLVPEAMAMTKKIEWATRFKLKNEKFASENFQIMNYGIGK